MTNYDKDYDEDYELFDYDLDEYEELQSRKDKNRSKRLIEEANPYLLEEKKLSWSTNITWENEVAKSKNLIYLLAALDIIKKYTAGVPIEELKNSFELLSQEEHDTIINYASEYFKQGNELKEKLQGQVVKK
jgi:hypothetical protein